MSLLRRKLTRWTFRNKKKDFFTTKSFLCSVRGFGLVISTAIIKKEKLPTKMSMISPEQMANLERIISQFLECDTLDILPEWWKNDQSLGFHFGNARLWTRVNGAIKYKQSMRSYQGIRHSRGLRVRGQRSRSSGRTNKIAKRRKKSKKSNDTKTK